METLPLEGRWRRAPADWPATPNLYMLDERKRARGWMTLTPERSSPTIAQVRPSDGSGQSQLGAEETGSRDNKTS
jgi:hypothetical protein